MDTNRLDFDNDYTASLAAVLFGGILVVGGVVGFICLWVNTGSFVAAIVLGLLILFFGGIAFAIAAAVISFVLAGVVSAGRGLRHRKPSVTASNTSL